MRIKKSSLLTALPILIYTAFTALGLHGFQQSHEDYTPMMRMLMEAGGEVDSFFQIPLMFYGTLSKIGIPPDIFAVIAGAFFTYLFFKQPSSPQKYAIKLLIYSAPLFTFLSQPGKELFLITALTIGLHALRKNNETRWIVSTGIYATLFRYYYAVIPLFYALTKKIPLRKLMIPAATATVLVLFFSDIFIDAITNIQARRDFAAANSAGTVRTVFSNITTPNDASSIIINYLYAAARLNLPIIFSPTIKELYLQVYLFATAYTILRIGKNDKSLQIATLAMISVYPLFEPDLGSYLRHFSSLTPIFMYIIDQSNEPKKIKSA